MARKRNSGAVLLVTSLVAAACALSPAGGAPSIAGVEPSEGPTGAEVEVLIRGEGFEPAVYRNAGCGADPVEIDDEFQGAVGPAALGSVILVDRETLSARVPGDLPPGTYDVEVVDPFGRVALLPAAYTVLDGGSDADTDTDSDADTDTDSDTDTDADGDTDTDSDADTDADADTDTDSDADTDNSEWDWVCSEGPCSENCLDGDCQMLCESSQECELDCQDGGCHLVCAGPGDCHLDCQAGGCTASNQDGGELEVQCQAGGCVLSCAGTGPCVVFCQGGGCSITDCGGGATNCGGGTWVCNRPCP